MEVPKEKVEHILSLKVMRLTKPTLSSPVVVTTDQKDLPGDLFNKELKMDPTSDSELVTLNSGFMMLIPQSFGNIYLGETFSSYMFTHNDGNEVAKDVVVKADLQTTSQRIPLTHPPNPANPPKELAPGSTIDQVIHHEVKEIGTHILICEVTYLNSSDKKLTFRKFYKFLVLKPLDVKTKFYNAEDFISDEVFLEAQVQNLTSGPINLEKVSLEASPLFKVASMNTGEDERPGAGILQPEASRQFLYCLSPIANVIGTSSIGILDIVWRSNLGERGRLQTSQLQRQAPDYGDIRLSVTKLPNIVKLEQPFSFSCRISNLSKRTMELTLDLERVQNDMAWVGTSGKSIGALEAGGAITLDLVVVPLSGGLRVISGIRLRDVYLNRTYDFDDLAQVFVT